MIVCTNYEIIADYLGLPADCPDLDEIIDCGLIALERAAADNGIATAYQSHFADWRGGCYDSARFPSVDMEGNLVIVNEPAHALAVRRAANAYYRALREAAANAKEAA